MSGANGHGPKKAILYARVSTDEQARSGYSLAQQMEALRGYAARGGYEVLEEVEDPGYSGAALARPGMDRVRDLVEEGGVDLVLAQDADRITREPYHRALLDEEFASHRCALHALDDWGDDSHEGALLKFIKGWQAKGERLKIAERTRRGLLRKAREGKVIRGPKPNFGFRFNQTNDGLIVHEPEMRIVEKIFRMAAEGMGPKAMQTRLYAEGIPSPTGKAHWPHRILKTRIVLNDLYRPRTYEEIAPLLSPKVAAGLDPNGHYGIWWYNRRNVTKKYGSGPDRDIGKRYKPRTSVRTRDEGDWIAVPVPACLSRPLVDLARSLIASREGNECKHRAREWELKNLMRCSCGQNMQTNTNHADSNCGPYHYYRCKRATAYGPEACPQKGIRVEKVEPPVWEFVSSMLKDPERIRLGAQAVIRQERDGGRTDLGQEAETWQSKLEECARLRRAYQDQQAAGLMTLNELSSRLGELDVTRKVAEAELAAFRRSRERAEELEQDVEAVLASLSGAIPEALDSLSGEERNRLYRMLQLTVTPTAEGYDAMGTLCAPGPTPLGE